MDFPSIPDPHAKFRHGGDVNLRNISTPQWWIREWAWIPFIQTNPVFGGVLASLNAYRIERVTSGYRLNPATAQAWREADKWLDILFQPFVRSNFFHPSFQVVSPPLPRQYAYDQIHKTHGAAHALCRLAKESFIMWLGKFSYLLASVEHMSTQETLTRWFRDCSALNVPEEQLKAYEASNVHIRDASVRRVGCFVRISENIHAPNPQFYI